VKPRLIVAFSLVFGAAVICSLNYDTWVSIPAARKLIAAQLRDPDSTQFRNDSLRPTGWLCGELNSKNGEGGYVGFRKFVSGGRSGDYYLEGEGEISSRHSDTDDRDFIGRLDEEIRILRQFNAMRQNDSSIEVPSKAEIRRQAEEAYARSTFEKQWQEHCS
jgi:hypothetical protein